MSCMNEPVLVTGSIVARTLVWWRAEGGFDVAMDEKAPEFCKGGHSINVCGAGPIVLGDSHPCCCNQMLEVNMVWEVLPSCA